MILAACQNKDDYQYDKVQVYAGINEEASTRVSDDGACFTNGDVIKVINTSRGTNNIAAYKYSESGREWTSEDLLLWEGYGENVFKAWYPSTASF